ncbi:MAG: hypothetical protein IIY07_05100, partial [Thermoguttaceae bacterium]|nr:hypothetical protein [Thermoguttaceae bacterium]
MKRSAIQCAAGLVGATLVVGGVFWTCRQLASPTQVNAASDVATSNVAFFDDAPSRTASSTVRPESSLTLSSPRSTTRPVAPASGSGLRSRAAERAAIRSTSGSELRLELVDEAEATPTFAEEPQTLETFAAEPVDEPVDDFPNAFAAPLATLEDSAELAPTFDDA